MQLFPFMFNKIPPFPSPSPRLRQPKTSPSLKPYLTHVHKGKNSSPFLHKKWCPCVIATHFNFSTICNSSQAFCQLNSNIKQSPRRVEMDLKKNGRLLSSRLFFSVVHLKLSPFPMFFFVKNVGKLQGLNLFFGGNLPC